MQFLGAAQIEEGLVDRQRFHERRRLQHQFADLAADRRVFCHVGANHDGVGAGLQRLEHRHGGTYAV